MKIALLFSLVAINFTCSKVLAESQENPIRVATITYSTALNKGREISSDYLNVIQDFTLLSLARNNIINHSPSEDGRTKCITSMVDEIGAIPTILTCGNPTRLEWRFLFLFSDSDDEVFQIDLSVKEAITLRRDYKLNINTIPEIPTYPEYATVWNRSSLIFCPAGFVSWESCHTDIITTARKLLTYFDNTH